MSFFKRVMNNNNNNKKKPPDLFILFLVESRSSSVHFSHSIMSNSLWPPWTGCQASLSITNSQSLLKLMSIKWVMPSNHLILCCPLLLLPSIFLSIRVFSNELVLDIRWPKYWNFSFIISPSNEYSGLISFKVDWFDLLAVQRTLKRQWYLSHRMSLEALCFNVLNSLRRICV